MSTQQVKLDDLLKSTGMTSKLCKKLNKLDTNKNGYLEGDIIASGSDTELTIHIIEPYIAPGDNGNVFDEPEFYKPIQKNSDIFRITKQGNSYSAKPLGNMKDYFDGIADEITVNKQ